MRMQRLDRDLAVRRPERLLADVDRSHPALADELDDAVLAGERASDQRIRRAVARELYAAERTERRMSFDLTLARRTEHGQRLGYQEARSRVPTVDRPRRDIAPRASPPSACSAPARRAPGCRSAGRPS